MSSISEKLLGNAVAEMANYLETLIPEDKRDLVQKGLNRLMSACFALGLVGGLMTGMMIMAIIIKLTGHLS